MISRMAVDGRSGLVGTLEGRVSGVVRNIPVCTARALQFRVTCAEGVVSPDSRTHTPKSAHAVAGRSTLLMCDALILSLDYPIYRPGSWSPVKNARRRRMVGFMFTLRRATADDEEPVAEMILARSAWMRQRDVAGWDGWESAAPVLAAQAADPGFPVWVLAREDGGIAGCTSLYEESPPWFWTEAERAEPAFFMATTVTDPVFAGQRVGARIAWSVLDMAARTGRRWVRRGATEPDLIRYYRDVQHWDVVRTVDHKGVRFTGMARLAEPQPDAGIRVAR